MIGMVMGIGAGISNFCGRVNAEMRIKIILAHSCLGAFSLTLVFFLELV